MLPSVKRKILPEKPFLRAQLLVYVQTALTAYEEGVYSQEFEDGGLINSLTDEERRRVFIPATNNHCEGILGEVRAADPSMSISTFLARAMYAHNNTEAFTKTVLTEAEDHAFNSQHQQEAQPHPISRSRRKEGE